MAGSAGYQNIAKRYATAFFELAQEQSQIDQIARDAEALEKLLASGSGLDAFLDNVTLTRKAQSDALLAVSRHLGLSALTEKLLGTLAAKRRLPALAGVVAEIRALVSEHKGETTADVTAAQALDQSQIDAIAKNLKQVLGKNVRVNLHVDADILGGLVIKVGSKLIDSSVRTKLDRLHRNLKNTNELSDQKKMREVA